MSWLRQAAAVIAVNLKSLRERLGSSAVAVLGFAGVVGVFIAVLSIAEGFRHVMASTGDDVTAIVLRSGSDTEMTSILGLDEFRVIEQAPGVARGSEGPLASGELFVVIDLQKRSTGTSANAPLRGVGPAAFEIRPEVRIVEGRKFRPGANELIAGRAAASQFEGLELGNTLRLGENTWTVVGIFEADGNLAESEAWTDVRVLQPAYRRGSSIQSVIVRLDSPASMRTFRDALTADPRLDVDVTPLNEFYAAQSRVLRTLIQVLGNLIALLMAVGATFGALNTMYSAVAARTREIATLRALGYRAGPVILSVLAESLLLALLGGLLGGGLAYLVADGYQTATLNWQSFSQVAFRLQVTPALLISGIAYALVMGLIGGLFPAWRAARLPVAEALRRA